MTYVTTFDVKNILRESTFKGTLPQNIVILKSGHIDPKTL